MSDHEYIPLASVDEPAKENERRIRARAKQDERWLAENGIAPCILDFDQEIDAAIRRGTRLDKSRILQTDEDNINYYQL